MGKTTVPINNALSPKLSSNNNPQTLYQSNSLPQLKFKFKSKLNPKHPIQSQTQAYLQALRILCLIGANSFSQKSSYILLLFTCNLKPEHKPRTYLKANHPFNPQLSCPTNLLLAVYLQLQTYSIEAAYSVLLLAQSRNIRKQRCVSRAETASLHHLDE